MGNRMKENNHGFTLVELVVVIVILAILAAILVPALLGYIDKAKKQQDILRARNCLTAAQTEFTELYALGSQIGSKVESNHDVVLQKTSEGKTIANKILEATDDDPYMLIIGTGDYEKYVKTDKHKAYTVYFVAYWSEEDKAPIFFNGSEWMSTYPWKWEGGNTFRVDGEDIKMQFYFVSAPSTDKNQNWRIIQNYLKRVA